MVCSKEEIVQIIQSRRAEIRALGVKRLGFFGSFARKEAGPESDVDLLVEFERGQKTFDNYIRMCFLLEEMLNLPVEIVTPEGASPYLRPYIEREVEDVLL